MRCITHGIVTPERMTRVAGHVTCFCHSDTTHNIHMSPIRPDPVPDGTVIAPELDFDASWDAASVAALIRSKTASGETPAFLFLGKREAGLLRDHLAQVFGVESVTTLKDTYYMGLEVVEVTCERFLFAGGRKPVREQNPQLTRGHFRGPWEREPMWRFRI